MKLYLKRKASPGCEKIARLKMNQLGLDYDGINMFEVTIKNGISKAKLKNIKDQLLTADFTSIPKKKDDLIGKIKAAVTTMLLDELPTPKLKNSAYLSKHLKYDYTYLANEFSAQMKITLEQYIINEKIERVKVLIIKHSLTLTEISYKLQYCNVGHLSQQFKKVTGITPTAFKELHQ